MFIRRDFSASPVGYFEGFEHGAGFVHGFLIFAAGNRIGNDARARLHVGASAFGHERSQADAGIEIAGKIEIEDAHRRKFRDAWARARR